MENYENLMLHVHVFGGMQGIQRFVDRAIYSTDIKTSFPSILIGEVGGETKDELYVNLAYYSWHQARNIEMDLNIRGGASNTTLEIIAATSEHPICIAYNKDVSFSSLVKALLNTTVFDYQ